jgi:hypothetical protein
MNIFVGNLALETDETELTDLFKAFGQVKSVQVMRELFSGASKGFGFVEMPGKAHSLAAIAALDGKDLHGKPLRVNEAMARPGGAPAETLVVDGQRCVVAEPLFLVDRCASCRCGDGGRGQLIVEPPTDIFGPGLATIRPPGVGLANAVGMQLR